MSNPNKNDEFSLEAIAEMRVKFKSIVNGADIHTINKASCYLGKTDDEFSVKKAQEIMPLCEKALNSGNFSELREKMKRWW